MGHAQREASKDRAAEQPAPAERHTTAVVRRRPIMVGAADDPAEHEADRVADRLVSAIGRSAGAATSGIPLTRSTRVRRSAASGVTGTATGAVVGAEGGALPVDAETRIRQMSGRGEQLDARVRPTFESALGQDLGHVRIHRGRAADELNRSMQAEAFTAGSDIFFSAGAYRPESTSGQHLLAHEIAHVAQQGPGLHRHVVVRRLFGKKKKTKTDTTAPTTTTDTTSTAKKDTKGKKGAKSSKGSKKGAPSAATTGTTATAPTTPDVRLQDSLAYEQALGRYLFNHPVANYAAVAVVDKLITALIKDFDATNKQHQQELAATFGKSDATSAGQVGTEFDAVWGALSQGNLRERMTAVYNVMFRGLQTTLLGIMKDGNWKEAQARGLNVDKLKNRKRQMATNPGTWIKPHPSSTGLYREPGNPLDRKNFSSYEHTGATRDEVDQSSERTVGDLESGTFSIGLSDREKKLQYGDQADGDISDEKLKWKEGGTFWKTRENNKWVKKVVNDLHMPVTAGPSGTTLKLWQVWEFVNKPVPAAHWRAAILGYMLSSNDHSFHEMMMISADYGLPYTPGARAYRKVDPFSEEELRKSVAPGRTFPDEGEFSRKMKDGKLNLVTEDAADYADTLGGTTGGDGEVASIAALLAYTDEDPSGYKFMNNLGGLLQKPKFLKFIKEDGHLREKYEKGEFDIASLASEAEEVSHHALTAMRMLEPYDGGTLYRGFKAFTTGGYAKGSTFTIGKFLSTSTKRTVAETFSRKGMGFNSIIIEIDGKTGIDLDKYSMVGGEGEVLFAPGSKFEITQAPKKDTDGTYIMKWADRSPQRQDSTPMAEDASGGGTLKNLQWDKQTAADNLDALVNPKAPAKSTGATLPTAPSGPPLSIYINTQGQLPITCNDPSDLTITGPATDVGWTVVVQTSTGEMGYVKDDELATFMGTGPVAPTTGTTAPLVPSGPSLIVYLTPDGDYPETVTDPSKLTVNGPANVGGWTSVIIGTGEDAGYGVAKDDELAAFLQGTSGASTTAAPSKPGNVVLHCGVTFTPEDAQDFKDKKNVTAYFDKEALEFLMYAQPGSDEDFDTVASILGTDKQTAGHLLFSAFAPSMK